MRDTFAIIKTLQVTEKGSRLSATGNKYQFIVDPAANKLDIKRAVEQLFKVEVVKVNTMNYRGKKKRLRTMRYGMTADWKRAVVTLKEGNKIEVG
jgi:large subunit ribosomal protein L23